MSILHIWPQEPARRDGHLILSATIEVPGEDQKTLWYRIPEDQETNLAPNADPFVMGSVYLIMQKGHDVQVHGEVSPSLLYNLEEFQAAWSAWLPDLKKVDIHADREQEPTIPGQQDESVVAFSGGVDSCFTAFSQVRAFNRTHPSHLAAGVMVQGFDIPLDQPEVFSSALKQSQTILSSLGLELIPIATNYRDLVLDWPHSFGAAAASCLSLFSGKFRTGFISQGFTYKGFLLLREGSNPLTDPLLSSDSFRIVPAGTEYTRADKIFAMREWDEFLHYLRVCWEGPRKDENCCKCEKCLRNILTFKALGLDLPPCFAKDADIGLIPSMRMGTGHLPDIRYGALVRLAKANNIQGAWIEALEKRLASIRHLERTRNSRIWQIYRGARRRAKKVVSKLTG